MRWRRDNAADASYASEATYSLAGTRLVELGSRKQPCSGSIVRGFKSHGPAKAGHYVLLTVWLSTSDRCSAERIREALLFVEHLAWDAGTQRLEEGRLICRGLRPFSGLNRDERVQRLV
jgi:hypothetical protein